MKKYFYTLAAAFLAVAPVMAQESTVATFEDYINPMTGEVLAAESFYNGETDQQGAFTSGTYVFPVNNSYGGMVWNGFAPSNRTATQFINLTPDQFNVVNGKGYKSSATFAIYYPSIFNGPAGTSEAVTGFLDSFEAKGMYVNNTAYAATSMSNGDSFAKKFGKGDWFKFTAYGKQTDGTFKTVDFYLADFTSDNESDWYTINDWTYVDLSSLGTVTEISFWPSGSDTGLYGLNTPAYFAMDNFGADYDGTSPKAKDMTTTGISEVNYSSVISAHEVARYTLNGTRLAAPQKGINIVKMSDGTTRKIIVK